MSKSTSVGPVLATIISCTVISLISIVVSQIRKGEPRLVQSLVTGVVAGIVITAIQYRMSKDRQG